MDVEDTVNIYFVIPSALKTENECSTDMKMAFQACMDNDYAAQWIKEGRCFSLNPTKKDVFVFEEFKGDVFNKFRSLKCVLLGPRCLTSCFMEKCPIPESNSPVFTTAMRGLIVTITNFGGPEKEELINKILYMGGLFSGKLITGTTHLVAKNVLSIKYERSVNRGLPVMTEKWVQAIWEASCQRNVHAKDPEFDVYKCPVFHGLTITSSHLSKILKEEMKNLIVEHGGTFTGQLEYGVAKIVIVTKPSGEKFKYAREWKVPCVLPSWVHTSVEAGYAVSIEPHLTPCESSDQEDGPRCSTPNSDESRMLPNFSIMSTVSNIPDTKKTHVSETRINITHVDETVYNVTGKSFISKITPAKVEEVKVSSRLKALDELNLRDAKKAGPFLDGCNVYLSGFNTDQIEKLRRVLNGGGATRFNEISESVTHIIIGEIVPTDMKTLKSSGYRPCIVSVDWIIESMKRKCPAPEDNFLCSDLLLQPMEPPSPLSKKGLQMLRKPTDKPVPTFTLSDNGSDDSKGVDTSGEKEELPEVEDLVKHYINSVPKDNDLGAVEPAQKVGTFEVVRCTDRPLHEEITPDEDSESTQNCTQFTESSLLPIFNDLRFFIVGYDEDDMKEKLQDVIESRGGHVVGKSFKGVADYAIVPLLGITFSQTASEVVTYFWVDDCLSQEKLVPVTYYHQPINIDSDKRPLADCVIAISSYMGVERDFIFFVAQQLGAVTQEMFARKASEKKNVLASTHLICSEPGSQKYNAALKWNLPAVTHEWLMACAKEVRRVTEESYVVKPSTKECAAAAVELHNMNSTSSHKGENPKPENLCSVREREETPKSVCNSSDGKKMEVLRPSSSSNKEGTPVVTNKRVEELQAHTLMGPPSSPISPRRFTTPKKGSSGFSQESPLNIPRIESTPKPGWPTDLSQPTPKGPFHITTPETPYGQVFKPNPSPETRKNWKKWIDNFPDFEKEKSPPRKRRNSTPLSELKRRCWDMIMKKDVSTKANGEAGNNPDANRIQDSMTENRCQLPSTSSSVLPRMDSTEKSKHDNDRQVGIQKQLAELNEYLTRRQSDVEKPVMKRLRTSDPPEPVENKNVSYDLEAIDKDSQGLVECMDPLEMRELEKETEKEEQKSVKKQFKFMISGIQDREYYEEIIVSLGGEVSDKPLFDPTSTHLICSRPMRSEKLLASIASGKWVLHKSFLDDSKKSGGFVQEEEYEWGNPLAQTLMRDLKLSDLETSLALAAHRWRCKLTKESTFAFVGVRALLCISPEREEPFKRLVLAGGGKIVDFNNLEDATHCFVELNKVNLPVDISILVKHRIPCVPPLYLNDYLIKNPSPEAFNCVVAEYKEILQR